VEELIYKCLSLYTPLLVRGTSIKPSHEITSIKETLIQVCDKGMKAHININPHKKTVIVNRLLRWI
jgi:hypothetical protein